MMKKLIIAALGGIALLSSQASMAAGTEIESGAEITSTDCTLLAERVTLTLSNNVIGAYQCDEATTEIRVATCHEAGSRQSNDYACVAAGDPVASCADGNDTYTIEADYRAFTGVSTGGTIAPQALGGNCELSSVSAVEIFD